MEPSDYKTRLKKHFRRYTIQSVEDSGPDLRIATARQDALGRDLSIIILQPTAAKNEDKRTAFQKQARILSALNHQTIPAIHQFGKIDDSLYTITTKLPRTTLSDLIATDEYDQINAAHIIKDLCLGIHQAHMANTMHGNIIPSNIRIESGHTPLITGFQSSPDTLSPYASPEIRDRSIQPDTASDIYSLGVILHQLLTRQNPKSNLAPPSKTPGINPLFDTIVAKATHRNPKIRYANAQQMAADLLHLAITHSPSSGLSGVISISEGKTGYTPPPIRAAHGQSLPNIPPTRPKFRKKQVSVIAAATTILLVLTVTLIHKTNTHAAPTPLVTPVTSSDASALLASRTAADIPAAIPEVPPLATSEVTLPPTINHYKILKNLRQKVIARTLRQIRQQDSDLVAHIDDHVNAAQSIPSDQIPRIVEKQKEIEAEYTNFTQTWKQLYIQICQEKIVDLDPIQDSATIQQLRAEIQRTQDELSKIAQFDPTR